MAGKMSKSPNLHFENLLWTSGCECVAGVDEAGVAPLAGPVVAAAVVFKCGVKLKDIPPVNDSKLLTPVRREQLYREILDLCDYGVGIASPREIDRINIFQAARLAMRRAVEKLKDVEVVLLDGPHCIPNFKIMQLAIIGGDAKVASIAAASIIAKTERDAIMSKIDKQYPAYGFSQHKGYPTKKHVAAILEHGSVKVHRTSFLKNILPV